MSVPALKDPATAPDTSICYTFAYITDESTRILRDKLGILQLSRRNDAKLLIWTPMGSNLPPGYLVLVKTDGEEDFFVKVITTTCAHYGCFAIASLNENALKRLHGTKNLFLLGSYGVGEPYKLPVPVENFREALDGPPAQDGVGYRHITEVLREHWRDLFDIR